MSVPGAPARSPESAPGAVAPDGEQTAAASGTDSALSDDVLATELLKLGIDPVADGGAVDTSLKFSGFADVSLLSVLGKAGKWRGAYERFPSFFVGNFNLYIDKRMTETLRMFGEVRFTFLPNGTAPPGTAPGEYQQTAAEDYANFKRALRWAGIYIPRVYLEWTPYRFLGFRAGVFLTPYGIWNVDHGTPTIIPAQRPFIVGLSLFPERQTGLEVFGQFDAGSHSTIGYQLTLSNGLGAVSEYRDLDANKGLGGRVYWAFDGFGELRIGGSAFYARDTTAHEAASLTADGKHVVFSQTINQQSDVLALAADVQWKYAGLLVQGELITQQRRYKEAGRLGSANSFFGRTIAPDDKFNWGVYGLLGYRFDWFGVMPYVLLQATDVLDADAGIRYIVNSLFFGLNIRPIDVLVVKLEYNQSHFPRGFIIDEDTRLIQAQIAWAF